MAETGIVGGVSFPAYGEADWRAAVDKALRGARFEEALVSQTDDGIRIDPLYSRRQDAAVLPRRNPKLPWHVVQRIDDPDVARANAQARADVENGATGLSLVFEGAPNAFGYGLPASPEGLAAVLDGIALNKTHIRIDVHPHSRPMADWLVAFMIKRRADPARLSLSFGIDSAAILAGTGRLRMSIEAMKASMPQSLAHFFAMGLPGVLLEADSRLFHNAGATEAQELAIMLSAAVGHLRMFEEARQALMYAAPHIGFALAVDQDQFLSTAKIRALRKLWARILEACGIEAPRTTVHAETSYRMMTAADPETNILRTTIAAFAAAVGGADSIAILPHTIAHGLPAGHARRIARNTQLVLARECRLDYVVDPSAGAGGIEHLTDALCAAAWKEFQTIEAEGGVFESLIAGSIQKRVLTARDARLADYREGRRALVGATLYRLDKERPVETLAAGKRPLPTDGAVFCERIAPVRIEEALEGKA